MKIYDSKVARIAAEGCRQINGASKNGLISHFFNRPAKVNTGKILSQLSLFDKDFYNCVDISGDSKQAVVVYHKDYLLVVLRESDQRTDWAYNLNLRSLDGYHAGFKEATDLVWVNLDRVLGTNNTRPIILSGFSLGGAIATVLVPKLVSRGERVLGCYTFGSPKVLLKSRASSYDMLFKSAFFRFQNTKDLFTYLPFGLGYSHVGHGLVFNPVDKKIQLMNGNPNEFSRFCKIDHKILENHSMDMYISALDNNVQS